MEYTDQEVVFLHTVVENARKLHAMLETTSIIMKRRQKVIQFMAMACVVVQNTLVGTTMGEGSHECPPQIEKSRTLLSVSMGFGMLGAIMTGAQSILLYEKRAQDCIASANTFRTIHYSISTEMLLPIQERMPFNQLRVLVQAQWDEACTSRPPIATDWFTTGNGISPIELETIPVF